MDVAEGRLGKGDVQSHTHVQLPSPFGWCGLAHCLVLVKQNLTVGNGGDGWKNRGGMSLLKSGVTKNLQPH